jgi:serine/threonine-protein kinase RsbW
MSDEHWIWRSDRVIPSETAAGRRVLEEVLDQLKAQRWVPRDIFAVHLAMHEALVNAITHGNQLAADKCVQVSCRMSPNLVRIEITDEGNGFDPVSVPDPTDPDRLESPTGRGVMLIKAFMSRVEFNEKGNQVLLEKRRCGESKHQLGGGQPRPATR